ncbi:MAG: hypothetical protein HKN84_02080 [Gammaproteobacteria bacterium]|nr:hypothetical protein [Gammaproteobacteria bacterium]
MHISTSLRNLATATFVVFMFSGMACAQQASVSSDATAFIEGVTGAGQPDEAELERLSAAGYAAVIDLRLPSEERGLANERASVEGQGMSYIPLPIDSRTDITFDKANELDRILAEIDGPVLIHCGSGNRVGALMSLRASMNGADDETAVEAGKQTGLTRLEPAVRERLQER